MTLPQTTIGALPAAVSPQLTDVFPGTNGTTTSKYTGTQLAALLGGGRSSGASVRMGANNYTLTNASAIVYPAGQAPLQIAIPSAGWYDLSAIVQVQAGTTANDNIQASIVNLAGPTVLVTESLSTLAANATGEIELSYQFYATGATTVAVYAENATAARGSVLGFASAPSATFIRYVTMSSDSSGIAPSISSFTPTFGTSASATITGSGFTGATGVSFNGASGTSLTLVSDTEITVTSPAIFTGGPISVTTPGGTAVSTANFTPMNTDQYLYINSNGNIVKASASTGTTITTYTGFGTGGLAVSSDNSTMYYSNDSTGTITKYNLATSSVVATWTGLAETVAMRTTRDGSTLYVGDLSNCTIHKIRTSDGTVLATWTTISGGGQCFGVTLSDDENSLYVDDDNNNRIWCLNTSDGSLRTAFGGTGYIPSSSGGIRLGCTSSDSSVLYYGSGNDVYSVHTSDGSFIAGWAIGSAIQGPSISSDNSKIYVACYTTSGSLYVVNTTSGSNIETYTFPYYLGGQAIAPW